MAVDGLAARRVAEVADSQLLGVEELAREAAFDSLDAGPVLDLHQVLDRVAAHRLSLERGGARLAGLDVAAAGDARLDRLGVGAVGRGPRLRGDDPVALDHRPRQRRLEGPAVPGV